MTSRGPQLLINSRAGRSGQLLSALVERARELGVEPRVVEAGQRLDEAAGEIAAQGATELGIAGGDGSLAAVAGVAVEHGLPLVAVPTGTLNHFARDAGLSPDRPLAALEAFAGREARVDVGRVNGRVFLNNVTVGLYGDAVADPDYRRHKLGVGWRTLREAIAHPERRRHLRLESPGGDPVDGVLTAVVTSNPHRTRRDAHLGRRRRLDTGLLQVTSAPRPTVGGIAHALAAKLGGPVVEPPAPMQWLCRRVEIEDRAGGTIYAGVDGEPLTLTGPVAVWSDPRALRLLVPDQVPPRGEQRRGRGALGRLRIWLRPPAPPVEPIFDGGRGPSRCA